MDKTKQEYFWKLPRWLQEDIIRENIMASDVYGKERYKQKIKHIEDSCYLRGYGLFPTRGEYAFPLQRTRRCPVGDPSLEPED